MIKPEDLLQQFGLSKQESEMYLIALAMGPSPVSQIAKKSNKTRTAAYFHVANLIEKGLLKESRVKSKRLVVALPPQELAARFDRLTTDFKSLVPQLEALHRTDDAKPVIRITDSSQGYHEIYDAISSLPEGTQFRVCEGRDAIEEELSILTENEWHTFFSRILDRKIETKALFTNESLAAPTKKLTQKNLDLLRRRVWHIRTLPESIIPFRDLIMIYGNTVAFVFPETKLIMTVQHDGVASALKAVFDGLFNLAQPVQQPWK